MLQSNIQFEITLHIELNSYFRFMVAARDINPLEIILKEHPAAVGPYTNTLQGCLQCFRKVDGNYTCTECGFPMCNEKCERGSLHREECQFFQEQNFGLNCNLSLQGASVSTKSNDSSSIKESLNPKQLFSSRRIPLEASAMAAACLSKAKVDQKLNIHLNKEDIKNDNTR